MAGIIVAGGTLVATHAAVTSRPRLGTRSSALTLFWLTRSLDGSSAATSTSNRHTNTFGVRSPRTTLRAHISQLTRSIDGTHHHVSTEHLHRYLAEFDFRYNTRKLNDSQRMERIVAQTGGRRLTYRATR
jgi:hypothetical protein